MIKALEAGLKDKGIAAKVIYSGGADVDILAAGASKGEGLKFLLKQASLLLLQNAPEPNCLCLKVGDLPLHPTPSFLGHELLYLTDMPICAILIRLMTDSLIDIKQIQWHVDLPQIEKGAGLPEDGVMVCGDSGNDVELFAVEGVRGCMVANAHPELRAYCDEHASPSVFQVRASHRHVALNHKS